MKSETKKIIAGAHDEHAPKPVSGRENAVLMAKLLAVAALLLLVLWLVETLMQ